MKNLLNEANNCFLCKNARCQKSCPIDTPIPEIIKLYKENNLEKAGEILFNNNPLSSICAIVWPHEDQCSGNCIRGIKGEPVHFYEIEKEISLKYLKNMKAVRLGIYTSLGFSLLLLIPGLNLSFLPLANIGFGWVIPTVLAILIGLFIFKEKPSTKKFKDVA